MIDSISLEINDNLAVGRHDPQERPRSPAHRHGTIDALVLSACVQMPSLPAVQLIEDRVGIPVVSSSVSTTFMMLKKLGLKTLRPDSARSLSGRY